MWNFFLLSLMPVDLSCKVWGQFANFGKKLRLVRTLLCSSVGKILKSQFTVNTVTAGERCGCIFRILRRSVGMSQDGAGETARALSDEQGCVRENRQERRCVEKVSGFRGVCIEI